MKPSEDDDPAVLKNAMNGLASRSTVDDFNLCGLNIDFWSAIVRSGAPFQRALELTSHVENLLDHR